MQYREIEQQKLREESILKSLQQANEKGEICDYSEEQIIEAQKLTEKKKLNEIYDRLVNPVLNTIIYTIYIIFTVILMPVVYLEEKSIKPAIVAFLLMIVMIMISVLFTNSVKKDTAKKRGWVNYLNKFCNDTYIVGYLLTSIGYLMIILDTVSFWLIYSAIAIVILFAIIFDFIKPLVVYISGILDEDS